MLSHPNSTIYLSVIRHQELRAECARYHLSAQVAPTRRSGRQLAVTQATVSAIASSLRTRLRELRDPEKLLETFSRIDYPLPM
jgi:hypothetical protein